MEKALGKFTAQRINIDKKIVDDSKVTDHHARYYARADYEST